MNEFLTHFTSFFFTQKKQKKKKKKIGAFFSKLKTLNRDPTREKSLVAFFIQTTALFYPHFYTYYCSTPSLWNKDDRKTTRVHLIITKESCFLVFERDVVFEIVVVSFERFRVRENIETKATLLYP
jgi:hypothetical protein